MRASRVAYMQPRRHRAGQPASAAGRGQGRRATACDGAAPYGPPAPHPLKAKPFKLTRLTLSSCHMLRVKARLYAAAGPAYERSRYSRRSTQGGGVILSPSQGTACRPRCTALLGCCYNLSRPHLPLHLPPTPATAGTTACTARPPRDALGRSRRRTHKKEPGAAGRRTIGAACKARQTWQSGGSMTEASL